MDTAFYDGYEWEECRDAKGWQVRFDKTGDSLHGVSTIALIVIDDEEQKTIDRYDTARYQKDEDKIVFYVCWSDGEWQPRSTHPTFEEAQKQANEFWINLDD